jgi:serine/threonine protein kinase
MELVDGDLFGLIHGTKGQEPLVMGFEMAKNLMAQIIKGVGYMHGHARSILDLTSSDIVYMRTGTDYHLKIVRAAWAHLTAFRSENASLTGTRGYHAPEVEWKDDYCIDGDDITYSADVFSVGLIFWEILTGIKPGETRFRDKLTNMQMKVTDLLNNGFKDPVTKLWSHPRRDDFEFIIKTTLQKQGYSRRYENFIVNMLQGDPNKRIPQAFGSDTLVRLNAITPF